MHINPVKGLRVDMESGKVRWKVGDGIVVYVIWWKVWIGDQGVG